MKITNKDFVFGENKSYNRKLISSLNEYLSYVDYIDDKWKGNLWFRGVGKSRYPLCPGIYRTDDWRYFNWDSMRTITDEFIRRASDSSFINTHKNLSRWEWMHIMQHHGLPTRLLDWTQGSLIGLYFALRDLPNISQPAVWVMDPYWLNIEVTGNNNLYYTDTTIQDSVDIEMTKHYLDPDIYHDNNISSHALPDYPIAISPPNVTPRINSQKGAFTIHGCISRGLTSIYKKSKSPQLIQLRLSNTSAENIKENLMTSGITESTLFPDLDGIARELRIYYGFREAFYK